MLVHRQWGLAGCHAGPPAVGPDVSCEVERRGLSYQLIMLLEELTAGVIDQNINVSIKQFKKFLLDEQ